MRNAAVLFVVMLVAVTALFGLQRRLIFPAPPGPPVSVPGFNAITYTTADGLVLRGLYRPAVLGSTTLLFCHGNGDTLRGAARATVPFVDAGFGVLLLEYRGYGGNPGKPTEAGLYADGRAALAWLAAHGVAADQIVLLGNSIGSGPAVQLATEGDYRGLVIVSGFADLPALIAGKFHVAGIERLVLDRFDNAGKLARVSAPVLILHGTADRVIPGSQTQQLARADPSATLRWFAGAGHDLVYQSRSSLAVMDWLARQNQPVRHRPPTRHRPVNLA